MTGTTTFRAIEHKWRPGRSASCWQSYWASPSQPVDTFFEVLPEFGPYGIGLLKGEFLRIRSGGLFARGAQTAWFTDLEAIGLKRLRRACWSHGHLSVVFASHRPEDLWAHYLSLGFFRPKGRTVYLGSGEASDPMGPCQAQRLRELVTAHPLSGCEKLFAFSGDADYFYEIFLSPDGKTR